MNKFKILIIALSLVGTSYAGSDIETGKSLSSTCVACHGADGNSVNPTWPKIAGQNAKYLLNQLKAFKQGDKGGRNNPVMLGIVANLSESDMASLAAYYAEQPMSGGSAEKKYVKLGQQLYRGGDIKRQIAACAACHGPAGKGNAAAGFPVVSGQHAPYTTIQLKAYRDGSRTNGPNGIMNDIAKKLTDADIAALASYLSGLH